jgi:ferrous iron transport protein A
VAGVLSIWNTIFTVFHRGKIMCNFNDNSNTMLSLADLKKGQKALIKSFTNESLSSKLIEMGCMPGESLFLSKVAPFGCPLAINIAGYELSLRKEEAASVLIELVA